MTTLTLTHQFEAFELPSYQRRGHYVAPAQNVPISLISDRLPRAEVIAVSSRLSYRLCADEHDILFAALRDSVEIRAILRRD